MRGRNVIFSRFVQVKVLFWKLHRASVTFLLRLCSINYVRKSRSKFAICIKRKMEYQEQTNKVQQVDIIHYYFFYYYALLSLIVTLHYVTVTILFINYVTQRRKSRSKFTICVSRVKYFDHTQLVPSIFMLLFLVFKKKIDWKLQMVTLRAYYVSVYD